MTMKVENGKTVTLEFVGKLKSGSTFLNSQDDGPLTFEVGEYKIIKGLNSAVLGMEVGSEKTVTIQPEDAFGKYDENLLIKITLDKLPPDAQKNMQLKSTDQEGFERIWTIKEVNQETQEAILDGNHILVDHELFFDIKVTAIK